MDEHSNSENAADWSVHTDCRRNLAGGPQAERATDFMMQRI